MSDEPKKTIDVKVADGLVCVVVPASDNFITAESAVRLAQMLMWAAAEVKGMDYVQAVLLGNKTT